MWPRAVRQKRAWNVPERTMKLECTDGAEGSEIRPEGQPWGEGGQIRWGLGWGGGLSGIKEFDFYLKSSGKPAEE